MAAWTTTDDRGSGAKYLQALRDHKALIVVIVLVAVAAAAAYSFTAQKRYQAEADIIVTPVSGSDDTFVGVGLLRDSGGQTQSVLTAARLVKTPEVAAGVAQQVGGNPTKLLAAISVTPLGQSNIVSVVGSAHTPDRAALLANTFAEQMIAQRTAQFQGQLHQMINRLQARINGTPAALRTNLATTTLQQRISVLDALVGGNDPTLAIASHAVAPASPVWPRPVLSIVAAFVGSLLLACGLAVALELVSPKVTREDELLLEQRLPILARVPRIPRKVVQGYLTGREPLPGGVRESYRTLRASLATAGADGGFPRTVLVTSAIPGEGKTMTSVNLAITLALAGQRVVLVDGDLRRPMIATVFGVPARSGLASALAGDAAFDEVLVPASGHGDHLRLLLASPEQAHLVDLLEEARVERLLAELRLDCDVVIVDSPPLTEVADALTLADACEAVIVAVRLGHTRRDRLAELRRILAQRGISPAGFVVTTDKPVRDDGSYYGTKPESIPAPRADRGRRRRHNETARVSGDSDVEHV